VNSYIGLYGDRDTFIRAEDEEEAKAKAIAVFRPRYPNRVMVIQNRRTS
jgi:hypothetical protein